jgi:hypothetical protein
MDGQQIGGPLTLSQTTPLYRVVLQTTNCCRKLPAGTTGVCGTLDIEMFLAIQTDQPP